MSSRHDTLRRGQAGKRPAWRAPYAVRPEESRGRRIAEPDCPTRSPYQRDRDRIIHSTAFRRLTYKTQVFLHHEGDHYRTRLTHTLEVAQIARTIARLLRLDEDLAEAIALAHDLGHPPFGHAGERALDAVMAPHGGFDHNAQSLRVVTALERKYAGFDGLNLTWETLEGLVKHNGPLTACETAPQSARGDGTPALHPIIRAYDREHPLDLASQPSAEAQVAAVADDIAYNNHDMDDGLRAGLIDFGDLAEVPLAARFIADVEARHGRLDRPRMIYEVNRRLITHMVNDVVDEARKRLARLAPQSARDIRAAAAPVVTFSAGMRSALDELRAFLFRRVYRHHRVMRVMQSAEAVIRDLVRHYTAHPEHLPERWRTAIQDGDGAKSEAARALTACDFVAGMTDRYAVCEHRRLFDDTPDLS